MGWPISTGLATALAARDRLPMWRADVTNDGTPVLTGLRVDASGSGSITISTDTPRRSVSVTLIDDGGDLVPAGSSSALAPFGNELSLYASLNLGGTVEWIPVGVFGIQSAVSAWAGGAVTVQVTGIDRSKRVGDDKLTDYVQTASGALATDVIHTLIDAALPADQQCSFTPITTTIAAQTFAPGDDRWADAENVAALVGCLLYFDPAAVCKLVPIPDVASAHPAWTFAPGDDSVMVSAQNSYDRSAAANIILATSQGTGVGAPIISIARNTDPTSPTNVDDFGPVVKTVDTSALTTQSDVDAYAAAQLKLYDGVTQQAQITCMPLWHLDAWDVIQAAASKVALTGKYVIDQISLPITTGGGTMSITTRGVVTGA